MSPKVPKAYLDARRKEIIQAAYRCFVTKGLHNTTMQDIFKASNLSPGAVYNYFSSKEELAVAALRESQVFFLSQLVSLASDNPEKTLHNMVNFWVDLLKGEYATDFARIQMDYYAEATHNEAIRRALLESQADVADVLIKIFRPDRRVAVSKPELDPLSVAVAMLAMFSGLGMYKLVDPDTNIGAFGNIYKAMVTSFLAAKPEKRLKAKKSKTKTPGSIS